VRSLARRGLRVQTFKVGPDFLDPTYLALASGWPCYNLDGWMTGREYVQQLFAHATADADIAVIEGVMGLFDGATPTSLEGSSAEIAQWLDLPVLLVTDAHGCARSLAAIVKGFAEFGPALRFAGVIANRIGSERHGKCLGESLLAAGLPALVGAVPSGALPTLHERHLGLVTATKGTLLKEMIDELGHARQKHLDLDTIWRRAVAGSAWKAQACPEADTASPSGPRVRIGIARDDAFQFYYVDNLETLARYVHVHFASCPPAAARFVAGCRQAALGGTA
jgi:cobyrinic acid a,c-diamide synthase